MIDSNKINEVVSRLTSRFNPERIILFGSHASGNPDKDSDLDLLIIQETELPMHKRGLDMRLALIGTMIPIDLLVYTKTEFEEEMKKRYSFISSAIKNSKLLYERAG